MLSQKLKGEKKNPLKFVALYLKKLLKKMLSKKKQINKKEKSLLKVKTFMNLQDETIINML